MKGKESPAYRSLVLVLGMCTSEMSLLATLDCVINVTSYKSLLFEHLFPHWSNRVVGIASNEITWRESGVWD